MRNALLAFTALAAIALSPGIGHAQINYTSGGQVAYTVALPGVSVAPGVQQVDASGFGYAYTPLYATATAPATGSWSNGQYGLSTSTWGYSGYYVGPLELPNDTTVWSGVYFGRSNNCSGSTCWGGPPAATSTVTLTTNVTERYFGALVNSYGHTKLDFYSGASLVSSIDMNQVGGLVNDNEGRLTYSSFLNVDFLGSSAGYDRVVMSTSEGSATGFSGFNIGMISVSQDPVSLTSLSSGVAPAAAPAPVLGATPLGGAFGIGLLGMIGFGRRSRAGRVAAA